jgi:hypothetical protein
MIVKTIMYKKLFIKNVWLLVSVTMLTGCATAQKYVNPTKGPVADVKITNSWGKGMFEMLKQRGRDLRENREVQFMIYEDKCVRPSMISVERPDFVKEITIPADHRLYLLAHGHKQAYRSPWGAPSHGNDAECDVSLSFVPEADGKYVIDFNQNGGKCFVTISKWIFNEGSSTLRKDRTTRREKKCRKSLMF